MTKQYRDTATNRGTLPGLRLVSVNEHPTGTPRKPNGLAPIGMHVWRVVHGLRK